jgi:hypothetical protein
MTAVTAGRIIGVEIGDLASALFFLLGSLFGLGLAIWTVWHEEQFDDNDIDDDAFYDALPYRLLSCLAATCYLLDVALDHDRRSRLVATCFAVGAATELLSTIFNSDWLMVIAVHAYLASAVWVLAQPPNNPLAGIGDVVFGIGCGFDVLLSYCYWNDDLGNVLVWGDVLSATLWFANALVVVALAVLSSSSSLLLLLCGGYSGNDQYSLSPLEASSSQLSTSPLEASSSSFFDDTKDADALMTVEHPTRLFR